MLVLWNNSFPNIESLILRFHFMPNMDCDLKERLNRAVPCMKGKLSKVDPVIIQRIDQYHDRFRVCFSEVLKKVEPIPANEKEFKAELSLCEQSYKRPEETKEVGPI